MPVLEQADLYAWGRSFLERLAVQHAEHAMREVTRCSSNRLSNMHGRADQRTLSNSDPSPEAQGDPPTQGGA